VVGRSDALVVGRLRFGIAGPVFGLLMLLLAGMVVTGAVAAIREAAGADRSSDGGGMLIVGLLLGGPGALYFVIWAVTIALRAAGPRWGTLAIEDDRLVIRDRWVLRRPLVLARTEVRGVRQTGRVALFSSDASLAIADFSYAINVRLDLVATRPGFDAAVRTPPPRGNGPATISRGRPASAIGLRVHDPDRLVTEIRRWLAVGPPASPSHAHDPGGCSASLSWLAFATITVMGYALVMAGLIAAA
jgi:hypothetical protein